MRFMLSLAFRDPFSGLLFLALSSGFVAPAAFLFGGSLFSLTNWIFFFLASSLSLLAFRAFRILPVML